MHAQMDRDQQHGVTEQVHLLGPPLHRSEAFLHQASVEECVEGVGSREPTLALRGPGHDHLHVEVDDLVIEPVQSGERLNVGGADLDFVSVDQNSLGK